MGTSVTSRDCNHTLNAAFAARVLYPQSAAQRRCSTPLLSVWDCPQQQPDTRDERSRQACKRGVPSRPACLSVCREELQTVKRSRPPRGGSHREISIAYLPLPSFASSGIIFSLCHNPEKLHVLVLQTCEYFFFPQGRRRNKTGRGELTGELLG